MASKIDCTLAGPLIDPYTIRLASAFACLAFPRAVIRGSLGANFVTSISAAIATVFCASAALSWVHSERSAEAETRTVVGGREDKAEVEDREGG